MESLTNPELLNELKQQAMEFYEANGVPQRMEEVLNSMFYDRPKDPYGHLANYFGAMSVSPTLTKVTSSEVLDGNGQLTVEARAHCLVKNVEQVCGKSTLTNNEEIKPENHEKMTVAIREYIEQDISNALKEMNPAEQENVDTVVYNIINKYLEEQREQELRENSPSADEEKTASSPVGKTDRTSPSKMRKSAQGKGKKGAAAAVVIPDEPTEKLIDGCGAICAVSFAICKAASEVQNVPLYRHVAALRHEECQEKFKIPIPIVTMLSCGKSSAGKVKGIKDFMLAPKPGMTLKESVGSIVKIFTHLKHNIATKSGQLDAHNLNNQRKNAKNSSPATSGTGALQVSLDKIEQGLDMLHEAIGATGLTAGQDFYIVLDLAAHEIFDYEKGKYEVLAGSHKLPEDMADFWADVLGKYPSVIGIIDPTRKADKESWMKLCEKVSERCMVVGDWVYHRPGLLKDEPIPEDFRTSAIILGLEPMTTVTDLIRAIKKMEDANNTVILGGNNSESTETTLADLAVGLGCRYIKVGAPCRGERTAKLNRLLEIEEELVAADQCAYWEAQMFPVITVPEVQPDINNDEGGSQRHETCAKSESKKK